MLNPSPTLGLYQTHYELGISSLGRSVEFLELVVCCHTTIIARMEAAQAKKPVRVSLVLESEKPI